MKEQTAILRCNKRSIRIGEGDLSSRGGGLVQMLRTKSEKTKVTRPVLAQVKFAKRRYPNRYRWRRDSEMLLIYMCRRAAIHTLHRCSPAHVDQQTYANLFTSGIIKTPWICNTLWTRNCAWPFSSHAWFSSLSFSQFLPTFLPIRLHRTSAARFLVSQRFSITPPLPLIQSWFTLF